MELGQVDQKGDALIAHILLVGESDCAQAMQIGRSLPMA